MAVEFKVKRTETATRQCKKCGGKGYTDVKVRGAVFKNKCTGGCHLGVITVNNDTEVSLIDALKELKLIP